MRKQFTTAYTKISVTLQVTRQAASITVHAQKDHVYNAKMTYSKKDGSLRLAYDNIAITLSGADAEITKDGVSLKTKSADTYMPIFINTFFKYYYAGEESSMDVSGVHSFGTTTLETSLSQSDTNAAGQRLWIDNETGASGQIGNTKIRRHDIYGNNIQIF